jgi:hypothetical protein
VIAILISQLFLLIAVGLTVSHWAMARTITLKQLQAALSSIQDQIQSLAKDK